MSQSTNKAAESSRAQASTLCTLPLPPPNSNRLTLLPSHLLSSSSSPPSPAYALRENAARSRMAGERRMGLLRRVGDARVGVTGGRGRTSKIGAGGRSGAGGVVDAGEEEEEVKEKGRVDVEAREDDDDDDRLARSRGGGESVKEGLTGESGRRRLRGLLTPMRGGGGTPLDKSTKWRRVGVTGAKGMAAVVVDEEVMAWRLGWSWLQVGSMPEWRRQADEGVKGEGRGGRRRVSATGGSCGRDSCLFVWTDLGREESRTSARTKKMREEKEARAVREERRGEEAADGGERTRTSKRSDESRRTNGNGERSSMDEGGEERAGGQRRALDRSLRLF